MPGRVRPGLGAALLVALFSLLGFGMPIAGLDASAETQSEIPARPLETKASKAYGVLETHCARCHQSARLETPPPLTGFLNILALDEIARDPSLVRPGLPDASALYTVLLRRAMPPEAWRDETVGKTGPTPDEIEAIRDWIEALPARPPAECEHRRLINTESVAREMTDALRRVPERATTRMRFVSLVDLFNACLSAEEIATQRVALVQILHRMSKQPQSVVAAEVDAAGLILRIDLDRIGWTVADWEQVAAAYPYRSFYPYDSFEAAVALESVRRLTGTAQPIVRADWLAHALLRQVTDVFRPPVQPTPARADSQPTPSAAPSLPAPLPPPIIALARLYERDAGLETAAAELGLTREELTTRLAALPQDYDTLVQRLTRGPVPREELITLEAAAMDAWDATAETAPNGTAPLRLALWTDKSAYAPGEPVTVSARASSDCYLTLISIDHAGKATVLFPNELEQSNLLKAGADVSVPGAGAGYQFRFGQQGRETVAGLCTVTRKIGPGIKLDYERQRFTSLGNWRAFLGQSLADINVVRRAAEEAPPRRRRGRVQPRKVEEVLEPLRPEHHVRTAITLDAR